MSRAGSDIGYCDSDYRENNTNRNLPSDEEVTKHLESIGLQVDDLRLGEEDLDIYFVHEGICYEIHDLDWDDYECFEKEDYLENYSECLSSCCGAAIDKGEKFCLHCEAFL